MNMLIASFCVVAWSVANASTLKSSSSELLTSDFEFAGQYRETGGNFEVAIDANRYLKISNGWLFYTRPLISQGPENFAATGYYQASNGCEVRVNTYFDFDRSANPPAVFAEFHFPESVIRGPFGGCSTIGDNIERYRLVRYQDQPHRSWSRELSARGCGTYGARQNLQQQFANLSHQCSSTGGSASSRLMRGEQCTPADPNDLACSFGYCTVQGEFYCRFSELRN